MADFDSSLPIRSEADGADERVHIKICDGTTAATMAQVDVDNNLHIEVHGDRADDQADVVLRLSETGDVNSDGVYDANNNSNPSSNGVVGHVRDATPAITDLTNRITSTQGSDDTTHWSLDVSMHDGNGDAISGSNPMPVEFELTGSGDAVYDYKKASSIASDATDDHVYQVTAAKVLTISKVMASASGKIKMELATGSSGTETEILAMFNSTANPNIIYEFFENQEVAATDWVVITITNLDNQAQDVYSVIEGEEN